MKWWKKLFEKKIDERQQADLYKVEHYGFWIAFYMLLISIIWQALFQDQPFSRWGAEWVVFMVIAVFEVAGCVKIGVWSPQADMPRRKENILWALGGSLLFSALNVAARYLALEEQQRNWIALGGMFIGSFLILFVLIIVGYTAVGIIFKKRRKKMEEMMDKECREDEDEE